MNIDTAGASYLSRLALPSLLAALASLDAVPVTMTVNGEWLAARRAIVAAIGAHNDIIRLARWIESFESAPKRKIGGTKSQKNRKNQ